MAYSKMTFADFKKKLKDGSYETATAARRGIGKADFSEDEKDKAQKLINKHFGDTPEPKKKAGKASKEKATKAKAAKAEKAGKAAKPAAGGKKRGRKPKAEKIAAQEEQAPKRRRVQEELFMTPEDKEAYSMLHLAGECIGTIHQSLEAMKLAKEVSPSIDQEDLDARASKAATALGNYTDYAVDLLAGKTPKVSNVETPTASTAGPTEEEAPAVDPEVMANLERTMGAAQGLPGHASPVQQPPAYQSPVAAPAPSAVHPTNGQHEGYGNTDAPPAVVPGPTPIS